MTTALITGASAGIGAVFAEQLASRKFDLVLVARSQDQLQALADSLSDQQGIRTTVIVQDLTVPNAAATVMAQLDQQGIVIDMLINNAGIGAYGEFAEVDLQTHLKMLQLNITVLVELTHRCLQGMRSRRSGSILNISSTAAFQPIPYFGTYAATKAFVLSFSEALWYECQPYNIKVVGVCPGPTETSFFKSADFPASMSDDIGRNYAAPEAVVADVLEALDGNPANIVTGGWTNQLLVNAGRLLPRETLTKAVGRMFERK